MWRGGFRLDLSVCRPFRLAVPQESCRDFRFHTPLIEPVWRISRNRLSDKTSRLRPRLVAPKRGQANEPEVPVEVREWIGPAPAPPDLVLAAQPPAQPHRCVIVECPVRFADGPYLKVVRPSAQRPVQL